MRGVRGAWPGRNRTVGDEVRLLLRAVVAVAVVLVTVGLATRAWLLVTLEPRVVVLRTSSVQLHRLHAAMVDQETGLRGYLTTRSQSFLQPYERALPESRAASDAISRVVPSGQLTRDLLQVQLAQQRWQDQWASRAAKGWTGPETTGTSTAERAELTRFMLDGKRLFDDYRAAHDSLVCEIESQLAAAGRLRNTWLSVSGYLEAGIGLSVIAVSLLAQRRLTRRVTEPVEVLARTVTEIRKGDLTARVPEMSAPVELADLGHSIDDMAVALQEQIAVSDERAEQARLHGDRLVAVLAAAREVAGSLSLRYVLDSVTGAVVKLGGSRARVWLAEDDDRTLTMTFDSSVARPGVQEVLQVEIGSGALGRAAVDGRPAGPEPLDGDSVVVVLPMIVGGRVIGVLEAHYAASSSPKPDAIEVLEALAGHAAGAVTAAQLHEQVNAHAVTDALTGLANRRAFDRDLGAEVARAVGRERSLCLIWLDLDHFKNVNDRHGHAYGDLALQRTAEAVLRTLRASDRAYRVGGEELVVLAPDTSAEQGVPLAERLREEIAQSACPDGERVTASLGVAELPEHGTTGETLLHAADRALYRAKANGRNRVELAIRVVVPEQDRDPEAHLSRQRLGINRAGGPST